MSTHQGFSRALGEFMKQDINSRVSRRLPNIVIISHGYATGCQKDVAFIHPFGNGFFKSFSVIADDSVTNGQGAAFGHLIIERKLIGIANHSG